MEQEPFRAETRLLAPTAALNQRFQLPETKVDLAAASLQKKFPRFSFSIGDINFAIHTRNACEVSEPPPIFALPNTQHWLCGIANIRGYIVPVFDLATYLGLQNDAKNKIAKLLITGEKENAAAIRIEGLPAHQIFTATDQQHQIPPIPARLRTYVYGVFSRKHMLWFDIDYENLLLSASRAAMQS